MSLILRQKISNNILRKCQFVRKALLSSVLESVLTTRDQSNEGAQSLCLERKFSHKSIVTQIVCLIIFLDICEPVSFLVHHGVSHLNMGKNQYLSIEAKRQGDRRLLGIVKLAPPT